jgi:cytochrome c
MMNISVGRIVAGAAVLASLSACGGDKSAQPAADTTSTTVTVDAAPMPMAPPALTPAAPASVVAPAAPAGVTLASLTGDAAAGEKVFGQCRACHVAEKGVNRVGPSLWAVVGRTAGSIEGFKYSKANKSSGLVWSEEQLFTYLEAPQRVVPGTTMSFGGLKKPQDRANVIAYLKTRA